MEEKSTGISKPWNLKFLILTWLDDDLGILSEIRKAEGAFPMVKPFGFEIRLIPSKEPAKGLDTILKPYKNTYATLYICYAGHAKLVQGKMVLFSHDKRRAAALEWSVLEKKILDLQCHTIVFLDLCDLESKLKPKLPSILTDKQELFPIPPVVECLVAISKDVNIRKRDSSFTRDLLEWLKSQKEEPGLDFCINLLHHVRMVDDSGGRVEESEDGDDGDEDFRESPFYGMLSGTYSASTQVMMSQLLDDDVF